MVDFDWCERPDDEPVDTPNWCTPAPDEPFFVEEPGVVEITDQLYNFFEGDSPYLPLLEGDQIRAVSLYVEGFVSRAIYKLESAALAYNESKWSDKPIQVRISRLVECFNVYETVLGQVKALDTYLEGLVLDFHYGTDISSEYRQLRDWLSRLKPRFLSNDRFYSLFSPLVDLRAESGDGSPFPLQGSEAALAKHLIPRKTAGPDEETLRAKVESLYAQLEAAAGEIMSTAFLEEDPGLYTFEGVSPNHITVGEGGKRRIPFRHARDSRILAEDPRLREAAYMAHYFVGPLAERFRSSEIPGIQVAMMNARHDLAQACGHLNYAELALHEIGLPNAEQVLAQIEKGLELLRGPNLLLVQTMEKALGRPLERYCDYAVDMREFKSGLSKAPELIKPHLELEKVIRGVLDVLSESSGLRFTLHSKEVDGSLFYEAELYLGESLFAVLELDLFERPGKAKEARSAYLKPSCGEKPLVKRAKITMDLPVSGLENGMHYLSIYNLRRLLHEGGHIAQYFSSSSQVGSIGDGLGLFHGEKEIPSSVWERLAYDTDFVARIAGLHSEEELELLKEAQRIGQISSCFTELMQNIDHYYNLYCYANWPGKLSVDEGVRWLQEAWAHVIDLFYVGPKELSGHYFANRLTPPFMWHTERAAISLYYFLAGNVSPTIYASFLDGDGHFCFDKFVQWNTDVLSEAGQVSLAFPDQVAKPSPS